MQEVGGPKVEKKGDDISINFKPSPNFKHMKKYMKYKFEEAGCRGTLEPENNPTSDNKQDYNVNAAVQPPLPPNSPPPDYPAHFVLKKEIIDDGYENIPEEMQNEAPEEQELKPRIVPILEENSKEIKEMCKDFARGNCKWDPCRYRHEIDIAQLSKVYNFCNDFANGKCKRAVCNFVHATTFEKEIYIRTGNLPLHLRATARPKDTPAPQPPAHMPDASAPPPPPIHMPVFPSVSSVPDFRTSCAPPLPPTMMSGPTMTVNPTMAYNMFTPPQPPPQLPHAPPPPSPPQRDWSECQENIGEVEEDVPKKCMKCKMAEIRYKENKLELDKIDISTQQIKDQIAALDQKKAKLLAVLTKVLWKDIPK